MSLFRRIITRGSPHQSKIQAAHQFVAQNYQPGDHVMLLADLWNEKIGESRYNATLQLATVLAAHPHTSASGSTLASGGIPIKCVYLNTLRMDMKWAGVDRVVSDFPCTVENMLFLCDEHAYAVQRGCNGQIMRKEAWHSENSLWLRWDDWLILQTRHFIDYDPSDLMRSDNSGGLVGRMCQSQLLSTMTHYNWTKRRRGLPHSDAIPTGGQLTRVSKITWTDYMGTHDGIVWSSQSFADGGYDDVCNTPLVGPRRM